MATDDTQSPADSDLPPDSSCMDTIDPMVPPEAGAEVSPSGAPNAAAVARDIGEAIAAGRRATPCSALEGVAQRLRRQEAAWQKTVTSIMALPVLPPATIALVQEPRKPSAFPPGMAETLQDVQSMLRGYDTTRSIMRSQVAWLVEIMGDQSRSAIAATWPRVSQLESEVARLIHMRDENLRRVIEQIRSSSFEREVAAVSNAMRLLRESVESQMPQWLEATSAVASFRELAAQVMAGWPPWPGAYESGPSKLFAGNVGGPESDSPSVALEVESSPIVMPARPSWRAHPGRRRSYARAIERRDQRERRALAGIVSADQWELLDQIACDQGCSITALIQGVLGILTGVPAPEAQHRVWTLGFGATPVRDTETPDETSNRVLIEDAGGLFRVSCGAEGGNFPKLKGLAILKILVDHPDQYFNCLDLRAFAAKGGVLRALVGENEAAARRYGMQEGRQRLRDLNEAIEEAKAHDGWKEVERLEEEKDTLFKSLGVVSGKRERARIDSPELENARAAVYSAIHYAYKALSAKMPALEEHLRKRVKTGFTCGYLGSNQKS